MTVEPRSQSIVLDGRRLHSLEWGADDAPVVVFLHGFTGHAWQTAHPAQVLANRFHVIALDQRGHGDSDPADVYGTRPMVDDLVGFLDALGIERTPLVGHSMGGIVGLCAAALHPGRFTRLALGDIGPEAAPEGIARVRADVGGRDTFTSAEDAVQDQLAMNPTADPVAQRFRTEHNLRALPDGTLTWKYDVALRDGTARHDGYATDEQWALYAAVDVPILILRGELSDILSIDIAERMLAANPRATLVTLPGAGHSIATDVPDLVTAALSEFLAPDA